MWKTKGSLSEFKTFDENCDEHNQPADNVTPQSHQKIAKTLQQSSQSAWSVSSLRGQRGIERAALLRGS